LDLIAVEEVVGVALERVECEAGKYEGNEFRVKLERFSDKVLAMSVHRDLVLRIIFALQAKGVEPYRCVDNQRSAGEYELLYIASEHPEIDLIRYQRILDNAA
jgi:hypothetical protein